MISSLALATASALGAAGLPPAWDGALHPVALHSRAPMPVAELRGVAVGIELCRPAGALWFARAGPFRLSATAAAAADDGGFRIRAPATVPVCSPPRPAPARFLTDLPIDPRRPRPGDPGQTVLASAARGGGGAGPVAAQGAGGGGGGSPLAGPALTVPAPPPGQTPPPAAAVPLPGAMALLLGALGMLGAIAGRFGRRLF